MTEPIKFTFQAQTQLQATSLTLSDCAPFTEIRRRFRDPIANNIVLLQISQAFSAALESLWTQGSEDVRTLSNLSRPLSPPRQVRTGTRPLTPIVHP